MANEILSELDKKQIDDLEVFLKEAFCIDGDCDFIEFVKVENSLKPLQSMLFALGDTKRGRFYITVSK